MRVKSSCGQQADVLGEEAEDDAVEEVGDFMGVEPAARAGSRRCPRPGRRPPAVMASLVMPGLSLSGVEEDGAEDLEVARLGQLGERDVVDLGAACR